ncbi:MAG: biotin transporter BioY [Treponema sp.]|nr:biotin transporter BioY [Treponema sp.]
MSKSTLRSVFIALFAALICAGCFISIPIGLVPITVQNMFALMSGVILGSIHGAAAVGIFLLLGALGIPVFSGVKGGIAVLSGPTGGFLIGYFVGALIAGLIVGSPKLEEKKLTFKVVGKIVLATIVAFVLNYAVGIPWFMSVMEAKGATKTLQDTLKICLIPFIPGDSIKIAVTIILSFIIRPIVARYLTEDDDDALKKD